MNKANNYKMLRFAFVLRSMNWLTFIVFTLAFYVHSILSRIAGLTVLDKVIFKYRCSHGYEFYARADDYWRFINHFEPKTTAFIEQVVRDNNVVVDIGAHIGIHTIHFAKKAKFVIAVEPEPQNFSLLKSNIRLNKIRNVLALPIALSDKEGYSTLFIAASSGSHSINKDHQIQLGVRFIDKVKVRTMTFDSLMRKLGISKVDIVKIDVEGHEDKVLQGMSETLKNNPPRIVIVEMDEDSFIVNKLKNYGYCQHIELDSWGTHINYAFIRC